MSSKKKTHLVSKYLRPCGELESSSSVVALAGGWANKNCTIRSPHSLCCTAQYTARGCASTAWRSNAIEPEKMSLDALSPCHPPSPTTRHSDHDPLGVGAGRCRPPNWSTPGVRVPPVAAPSILAHELAPETPLTPWRFPWRLSSRRWGTLVRTLRYNIAAARPRGQRKRRQSNRSQSIA